MSLVFLFMCTAISSTPDTVRH